MIGVEHCDRCGFDRSQWNRQDAERTLLHSTDLFDAWMLDALPELIEKLDTRRVDDLKAIDASSDLFDQVHHLWHGLVWIADARRAADDAVDRQRGRVDQINASPGGVPKTAIDSAIIGMRGIDGDVQAVRAHHGRPWQALCLFGREVIDRFAKQGHPIAPGSTGENVTIAGLEWATMRAGTIIDIGEVRVQLSAPAVPCKKNARWFSDGDFTRLDHDLHPGSSRWYASVLVPGTIASEDAVTVSGC